IARGDLNNKEVILLITIISLLYLALNLLFFKKEILIYTLLLIFLNILYSWKIKKIILLDAIIVSLGFLLRIISGFACIQQKIDIYMLLWIFTLSILVALAKRLNPTIANHHKKVVDNIYLILSPVSIISNYIFLANLKISPVIFLSVFLLVIGMLRFYYYLNHLNKHLSPFEILFNDRYLFVIVLINLVFCFTIIYL
ncbi:MAG: hypothetical protein N2169_07160, partial [bacterium]|nr:hypothetical protein [bacterium]